MRIVVAYKWASNPQEAVVGVDGNVDWSRARPGISEYDPIAIELARRLADEVGGEVIGLTAGTKVVGTAIACKTALSRGLDRTVVVDDDCLEGSGTTEMAGVLAAVVRYIGDVDLVLTGDSSVDVGAKMIPTVLAGCLGWPAVSDVMFRRGSRWCTARGAHRPRRHRDHRDCRSRRRGGLCRCRCAPRAGYEGSARGWKQTRGTSGGSIAGSTSAERQRCHQEHLTPQSQGS